MPKKPLTHVTRLHPEQAEQIQSVQAFRDAARMLQSRVSKGSYGDADVEAFWRLAQDANLTLRIANSEIAERAGLGLNFFSTVVPNQRRPKISNFLRSLDTFIEIADER